jgi:hypothetical protein
MGEPEFISRAREFTSPKPDLRGGLHAGHVAGGRYVGGMEAGAAAQDMS